MQIFKFKMKASEHSHQEITLGKVFLQNIITKAEFKIFIASIFELQMRRHVGKEHFKRILLKLGKGEFDNVPKDLIVDFVVEKGAFEFRKAFDNFDVLNDD